MKRSDFTPCLICGKGVAHTGVPIFYRVKVETMGLNIAAVEREHGLEVMLGQAAPLADVFGPNESLANIVDSGSGLICMNCGVLEVGQLIGAVK